MITVHEEMVQGSEPWHAARCGLLTASEMHLIITPLTLKVASNDKERAHFYELLAQRTTRYVEPSYVGDAMLRGQDEEIDAVALYAERYAPVEQVGFITNDKWGFTIGYSPDGVIGKDGLIECKSRKQALQIRTYLEYLAHDTIAPEFVIQAQTGLLVSERKWIDLVSYCGGLPMATVRVLPDLRVQDAIIVAASAFEQRLKGATLALDAVMKSKARLIPTERKIYEEMMIYE